MTDIQFANLESTHNEIIGKCKFNETDFISPSHLDDNPAVESNRRHSDTNTRNNNSSDPMPNRLPERNFDTILEIFRGAAGGFTTYNSGGRTGPGKNTQQMPGQETVHHI